MASQPGRLVADILPKKSDLVARAPLSESGWLELAPSLTGRAKNVPGRLWTQAVGVLSGPPLISFPPALPEFN